MRFLGQAHLSISDVPVDKHDLVVNQISGVEYVLTVGFVPVIESNFTAEFIFVIEVVPVVKSKSQVVIPRIIPYQSEA
jgi:hypothetical protein